MRITWQLYINVTVFSIIFYILFNFVLQSLKDFMNKEERTGKILPTLAHFDPRARHRKEKEDKIRRDKIEKEKEEYWKIENRE